MYLTCNLGLINTLILVWLQVIALELEKKASASKGGKKKAPSMTTTYVNLGQAGGKGEPMPIAISGFKPLLTVSRLRHQEDVIYSTKLLEKVSCSCLSLQTSVTFDGCWLLVALRHLLTTKATYRWLMEKRPSHR